MNNSSGTNYVSKSQWSGTFPLLKKSCETRVIAPRHDDIVLSSSSALRESLSSKGEEATVADVQHGVEHLVYGVSADLPLEATVSGDHGQEVEASKSGGHGQQVDDLSLEASESGGHG
ncbi:hypothetical protein V6N11_016672 [Hibiscus sabdariffa]|uniref:Uncharacterized protein n=1 Tax=Hibiscus sabdariffa TaxID=183260 RepID=A0ABR2TVW6_9ROSI